MSKKATIIGLGSYVPEKVLSNQDLEKIVETSDEWITTRTGMKERRIAAETEFASTMGANAATRALQKANIDASEIDCVILATCTPDYLAMSTACIIQDMIGAKNAAAMDIQAACSGFLYGLFMAKSFIESNTYQNILVVASEKLSSFTNYQDRTTCILFGDGAAACVVSSKKQAGFVIDSMTLGADGEFAPLGLVPAGGCRNPASLKTFERQMHAIQMKGNDIFKHAVRKMEQCSKECLEKAELEQEQISWIVPHQANIRIIDALAKRFDLSNDRVYTTIHKYGNTSASTIGIALDELMQKNSLDNNEHILLTAFGFGLTWGAGVITYQKV